MCTTDAATIGENTQTVYNVRLEGIRRRRRRARPSHARTHGRSPRPHCRCPDAYYICML